MILVFIVFISIFQSISCSDEHLNDRIVLAITACGKKAKYHLPSFLGSLLETQPKQTRSRLALYLFGDDEIWKTFHNTGCFKTLKSHFQSLTYQNLSNYSFKEGGSSLLSRYWKFDSRYACASFKLNMITMLPTSINRLIYMDIDTIIFEDLANLYSYFIIHPGKIMYLAMESYRETFGYYANPKWNSSGKNHFYQPTGVNSGVILMNLDLMRRLEPPLNFETFIRMNDEPITMGDQDLFNTWSYYNTNQVYILPCKWNRRSDSSCSSGETTIASNGKSSPIWNGFDEFEQAGGILHASRRVFMRHVIYPRHYELYTNKTQDFYRKTCNLSHVIQTGKRGNSVYIN